MRTDDEVEMARRTARLERAVALREGAHVLTRLRAACAEANRVEQLTARRDELARRCAAVGDEAAHWRYETKARSDVLRNGGERTQRWSTSFVRLTFRLLLAVAAFRAVVEAGTVAALALALLPIGVVWVVWLSEVRR